MRAPVDLHGEDMHTKGRFTVSAGERAGLRPPAPAVQPGAAAGHRPRGGPCRYRSLLDRFLLALSRCRQLDRRGAPLADHPEGADLPSNRRHRRGRDDVAARGDRRQPQLGLPLLLAAGRHVDADGLHGSRLLRGSRGLARMADAVGRGRSGADADHVRRRRRARIFWNGKCPGSKASGRRSRSASATPPPNSSSSTSMARSPTFWRRRAPAALPRIRARRRSPIRSCRSWRRHLAPPRRRHLGDPRRPPAFRPLEGHGLGRLRPRVEDGRRHRGRRELRRALARGGRRHPCRCLREGLRRGARLLRAVLWFDGAGRQPAPHPADRFPAGRTIRGCRARSRRSSSGCCATAS